MSTSARRIRRSTLPLLWVLIFLLAPLFAKASFHELEDADWHLPPPPHHMRTATCGEEGSDFFVQWKYPVFGIQAADEVVASLLGVSLAQECAELETARATAAQNLLSAPDLDQAESGERGDGVASGDLASPGPDRETQYMNDLDDAAEPPDEATDEDPECPIQSQGEVTVYRASERLVILFSESSEMGGCGNPYHQVRSTVVDWRDQRVLTFEDLFARPMPWYWVHKDFVPTGDGILLLVSGGLAPLTIAVPFAELAVFEPRLEYWDTLKDKTGPHSASPADRAP